MNRLRCAKISRSARRGAVLVEFALTAPLLFLMLLAALELGHANMVLNVAEAAAYEGAREGIVPGTTSAEVESAAQGILTTSAVRAARISVTPSNLRQDSDQIDVTIEVPYAANTIIPPFFVRNLTITRSCRLTRERG